MGDNAETLKWPCDAGKEDWKKAETFHRFLNIRAIW